MRIRQLKRTTTVASAIEDVFDFFSDTSNLLKVTPDTFPVRILGEMPEEMGEGTTIRLRMRLFKLLPLTWETRIEKWDPPHEFVDTQPKGPYRYWKHTHRFEERGENTEIIDHVEYAVPGWLLEPLIHRFIVKRSLHNLFDYRQLKYTQLLGSV